MAWDVDTLREHIMALIDANDKRYGERSLAQKEAVESALRSAEQAVRKAEAAAERRFEGVNEFRSTLADQQRTLIPRSEVEVIVNGLNKEIEGLKTRIAAAEEQKKGGKDVIAWVAAAISAIVAILAIISRFLPLTGH